MCDSSTPDTSGINAAALAQAQLSREQLDFVKSVYAGDAGNRADASAAGRRASAQQETATGQQIALTDQYAQQQGKQFGFEDGLRTDAQTYDSPERAAANAARATAGVTQSFDNVQAQSNRNLERSGVMPGSGRALAMTGQLDTQKATAQAGAANKSYIDSEAQGYARKMDSANLGRNLASNQATSANTALGLGNASVANAQVPLTVSQNGLASMNSGFSGAGSLMASSGGLYGTAGGITNAANAANSAAMSGLGSAVGGISMAI